MYMPTITPKIVIEITGIALAAWLIYELILIVIHERRK